MASRRQGCVQLWVSSSLIRRTRAEGGRERTEQETFVYPVNKHPPMPGRPPAPADQAASLKEKGRHPAPGLGAGTPHHEGWRAIFLASGTGKGGPWVRTCTHMRTGDNQKERGPRESVREPVGTRWDAALGLFSRARVQTDTSSRGSGKAVPTDGHPFGGKHNILSKYPNETHHRKTPNTHPPKNAQ